MVDAASPLNWHTAAFLIVSGLALALVFTGPQPGAPGMPASEAHANRWEFGSCPSCHDPIDLPEDHRAAQETLHPLYSRCYLCHR
jgi:hypothetical protein